MDLASRQTDQLNLSLMRAKAMRWLRLSLEFGGEQSPNAKVGSWLNECYGTDFGISRQPI